MQQLMMLIQKFPRSIVAFFWISLAVVEYIMLIFLAWIDEKAFFQFAPVTVPVLALTSVWWYVLTVHFARVSGVSAKPVNRYIFYGSMSIVALPLLLLDMNMVITSFVSMPLYWKFALISHTAFVVFLFGVELVDYKLFHKNKLWKESGDE